MSLGAAARAFAVKGSEDEGLRDWIPRMRAKIAHSGNVQDMSKDNRVVVVMTTIPPRIDRLEPVLDSMLAQTWPVESIYLSIPYRYNRTGELYTIPGWLSSKTGVQIFRCEDLGPGTHLLNGLKIEQDPWTWMVVVDDDHIYSPSLVESLMRAATANPGRAIAAQGFLSIPGLKIEKDAPRYLHDQGFSSGPVLVSYLGVVYQRGFFDDSVFDYNPFSEKCRYQDDMWFSAHLARKGIARAVLGAALGVTELKDLHLGPSSLTFWKENRPKKVSEDCNLSLLQMYADLWKLRRRTVIAINGLPAFIDMPTPSARMQGPRWEEVFAVLKRLPHVPDLVYLCSESRDALGQAPPVAREKRLGISEWVDGVLVTLSENCQPDDPEARISRLLRDPMQWEADDETVVIMGTLREVSRQGDSLPMLVSCAAQKGPKLGEKPKPVLSGETPFCRFDEIVAVTVGGFGASQK